MLPFYAFFHICSQPSLPGSPVASVPLLYLKGPLSRVILAHIHLPLEVHLSGHSGQHSLFCCAAVVFIAPAQHGEMGLPHPMHVRCHWSSPPITENEHIMERENYIFETLSPGITQQTQTNILEVSQTHSFRHLVCKTSLRYSVWVCSKSKTNLTY